MKNNFSMKKSIYIFVLLASINSFLLNQKLSAQVSVMSVDVQKQNIRIYKNDFGPNKTHYVGGYISFAFAFDAPIDNEYEKVIDTEFWGGGSFDIGMYYKFKLNHFFALGSDLYFSSQSYRLGELGSVTPIPITSIDFNREWFSVNRFGIAPWFRINVNKRRGNHLGNFIDLGGFVNWNFAESQRYAVHEGAFSTRKADLIVRELDMFNDYDYGFLFRLGLNKIVFFSEFRWNNLLIDESINTPGSIFPRFRTGIRIGS